MSQHLENVHHPQPPEDSNTPNMTRWKENSVKGSNEEEEDLEIHNDNATFDTTLLFPKESKDPPIFPNLVTATFWSRKHFVIMTCKRTFLACRGLLLFFILFLIVSFIATVASNSSSSSESTEHFDGPPGRYAGGDESTSSSGSDSAADETQSDLPEPVKNYQNISIMLPTPVKYSPGRGNMSQVKVKFNLECGYTKTSFALIGNSLRRALEFYERNVKDISVLDAALGTKIVAEQLKLANKYHPNLPRDIRNFVYDLSKKSSGLTYQITDTVKRVSNSPKSLRYTLPWIEIEGLWELPQNGSWHRLGELKDYEPPPGQGYEDLWNIASRGEIIDENESDACIYQVFRCDTSNITERCRVVFLDVERSMYSLTHQVIYMLLVQKNQCYEQPTWRRVPNLRDKGESFLEELCGKVWQEANSIVDAEFPPRFRDLFIEQIGMCALAGYTEFLDRAWLRRIISWQSISASGCFGEKGRRRVPAYPNVATVLRDYSSQEQMYQDHYNQQQAMMNNNNYNPHVYGNGKKHPLRETLNDNSSEPLAKRGRFDNIVLLRSTERNNFDGRNSDSNNVANRRLLRAGKRKRPSGEDVSDSPPVTSAPMPSTDENDIISQLTKEFKKARLRPVFFTISSFIEQTVDEVGFTMAEEPETEITVRLNLNRTHEPETAATSKIMEKPETGLECGQEETALNCVTKDIKPKEEHPECNNNDTLTV